VGKHKPTFYFFSIWGDRPDKTKPRLMWCSAEEAAAAHDDGVEGFIADIIQLDSSLFVAMQVCHGKVPRCLCCHEFGERHEHMAMLFHYDAQALRVVTPRGCLSPTEAAPLDADDIEWVFDQLSRHPNYKGQTVVGISKDHEIIELKGDDIRRVGPS